MLINVNNIVLIIFFMLSLFTSVIMQIFNTGSMTQGTLTFVVLYSFLFILKPIRIFFLKKNLNLFLICLFIIFLISMISFFYQQNFEYKRFLHSYILLIFFLFIAYITSVYFKNVSTESFYNISRLIFYILLIDGFYSTIKYIFGSDKKTILFSEPSHLAIILLPFFLSKILNNKQKGSNSLFIIILILFIAVIFQNLTLLVGVIFVLLMAFSFKYFTISFFSLILFTLSSQIKMDYFFSRINLVDETNNISTLVFLSGWERTLLNLKETFGLGLGLNQLGYIGPDGFFMEKLYELTKFKPNYNDGGTIGSKMISELGMFALILLIIYLFYIIKFHIKLKKYLYILDSKDVFFLSVFMMFFMEVFIRGGGYFSPTSFLFLVSIFYLSTNTNHKLKISLYEKK